VWVAVGEPVCAAGEDVADRCSARRAGAWTEEPTAPAVEPDEHQKWLVEWLA